MGMTGSGMANAVLTWVSANNPNYNSLSGTEKTAFLAQLTGYFGAQVGYIQTSAVVPSGISVLVSTSTGAGSTNGPGSVQ